VCVCTQRLVIVGKGEGFVLTIVCYESVNCGQSQLTGSRYSTNNKIHDFIQHCFLKLCLQVHSDAANVYLACLCLWVQIIIAWQKMQAFLCVEILRHVCGDCFVYSVLSIRQAFLARMSGKKRESP